MKKEHTKQILETVFNYYRLYSENNYRHTFIYKAILQRKRSVSQNRAATKKKKKKVPKQTLALVYQVTYKEESLCKSQGKDTLFQ